MQRFEQCLSAAASLTDLDTGCGHKQQEPINKCNDTGHAPFFLSTIRPRFLGFWPKTTSSPSLKDHWLWKWSRRWLEWDSEGIRNQSFPRCCAARPHMNTQVPVRLQARWRAEVLAHGDRNATPQAGEELSEERHRDPQVCSPQRLRQERQTPVSFWFWQQNHTEDSPDAGCSRHSGSSINSLGESRRLLGVPICCFLTQTES